MTQVTFVKTFARHPFECSICFGDQNTGTTTLEHKAGDVFHRFCETCLSPWLKRKSACPTCKGVVTMVTTSQSLNNAALRGNLAALQTLLPERNSILQDVLDEVFLTAVQNRRAACVRFLCDREVSFPARKKGLEVAREFGYLEIAQIIDPRFHPTLREKIRSVFCFMLNK